MIHTPLKYLHTYLPAGTRITAEIWNSQFHAISKVANNLDDTLIAFSEDYTVIREDLLEATTNANTAATNANTATTNTNAAISLAEAGAQDAHDAADDARQATQEMSDAADRADAAAINANSKADKANLAANTADSATGLANTATANANTATGLANEAVIRVDNSIEDMNAEIDDALSEMQDDVNSAISLANSATVAANTATNNANNVIADTVVAITATEAATNAAIDATVDTYAAGSYAQTQGDLTKAAIVTANSATDAAIYSANTADSAAEDAHTAKDAANTAAGLANTATTNANAATADANVATGLANTATSNANAAATAANTAAENANDAAASIPGMLTSHNEDPDAHEILRNRVYRCLGDANDISLLGFEMPVGSDRHGILVDFRPSLDNDPNLDTLLMGFPAYEEGTANTKPTLIAGRVYSAWFDPEKGWTILKSNGEGVSELPIAANGVLGAVKGLATGDNTVSVNGVDGTMSVPRIASDTVSSALQSRVAIFDANAKLGASSDITVSNLDALSNVDYSIHDALNARVLATEKGAANGIAPLDANSKVPTGNLPSFVTPTQLTNHNTSPDSHPSLRSKVYWALNSGNSNALNLSELVLPSEIDDGLLVTFRVTHPLNAGESATLNGYLLFDNDESYATPMIVPGEIYSARFSTGMSVFYMVELPAASTSKPGIIRAATIFESSQGFYNNLAISPAGLHSLFGAQYGIADLDGSGKVTPDMLPLATQAEATAMTTSAKLMTPLRVGQSLATHSDNATIHTSSTEKALLDTLKTARQVTKIYDVTPVLQEGEAMFTITDADLTLTDGLEISIKPTASFTIQFSTILTFNGAYTTILYDNGLHEASILSMRANIVYNLTYRDTTWICTNYPDVLPTLTPKRQSVPMYWVGWTGTTSATFNITDPTLVVSEGTTIILKPTSPTPTGMLSVQLSVNGGASTVIILNQAYSSYQVPSLARDRLYLLTYTEVYTPTSSAMRWVCTNYTDTSRGWASWASHIGGTDLTTSLTTESAISPFTLPFKTYHYHSRVVVRVSLYCKINIRTLYFTARVDGGSSRTLLNCSSNVEVPLNGIASFTSLAPGDHTLTILWRVQNAGDVATIPGWKFHTIEVEEII